MSTTLQREILTINRILNFSGPSKHKHLTYIESNSYSSSSSDTDGDTFIDLTNEVGKPSKRHHGR